MTAIILSIFLASYMRLDKPLKLFDIPSQTINLYKILGKYSRGEAQTTKACQISEFVTYRAYKEYLNAVRKDSSVLYYQSQLPDSNIASAVIRQKYITSSNYDNYPVLGISWDNAMNFCRWKTLRENKDSIRFIYRLPNCSEWLAAYHYLHENKIENDFNKNYSDWLINTMDESDYRFAKDEKEVFAYNYLYFHRKNDSPVLKRKFVIGDSYLFQQDKLLNYYSFSYYATQGYRQVSFRYIKEFVIQSDKMPSGKKSLATSILKYWGIR